MHISPEHDIFNLNERKHIDFEWIKDWFSFCVAIEPRQLDDQAFQQKKAAGSLIEEVDGVVVCRCPQNMDDQQSIYAIITALHDQMKNHNHAQQINDKLHSHILLAQKVKHFLDDIDEQKLSETQQKIYDPLYQAIADTASLIPDQVTSLSPADEKEVLTHLLGNERFYDIATERAENTDDGYLTQGYKTRKLTQVLNIMSRVHTSSRGIARSTAERTYDLFLEGSHLLDMADSSLPDSIFHVGEDKLFDEAMLDDGTKLQDLIREYVQKRPSATALERENVIRDFARKINQSYSIADTDGSPRQTLENRHTQCVAEAHLGEMLRQIEGVRYQIMLLTQHVASLIAYGGKLYYVDIGHEIVYSLSSWEYIHVVGGELPDSIINQYKETEYYDILLEDTACGVVDRSLGSMYFNMGDMYSEMKQYNNAIQAYKKAIRLGDVESYINMGVAYQEDKQYHNAIQVYQIAIDKGEKKRAYLNMGVAYQEDKQYHNAIQAYKKAIDDGYTQVYFSIGDIYYKNRNYKKSVESYREFIKLHKDQDQYREHVSDAQKTIDTIIQKNQQYQDI